MEVGMWILTTLVAAAAPAVVALSPPPPASAILRSDPVLVTFVFDGDTIAVTTFGRVRLLGIDAPEIGRGFDTAAPFGREARDRLTGMILHRWVRLEREGPAVDAYNRHLAYVMREDGVCVNAELVRDGLARVTARQPLARLAELKRAEKEAQTLRKGMWGATPGIPSASYTRPSGAKRSPASKRSTPTARKKKKKPT
jgi:micrococcal nuclease